MLFEKGYLKGRPSWYSGYLELVAKYVVKNATVKTNRYGRQERTVDSIHFDTCEIVTIHDVNEYVTENWEFDSFSEGNARGTCHTNATVTCACGMITRKVFEVKDQTMASCITSAFWQNKG